MILNKRFFQIMKILLVLFYLLLMEPLASGAIQEARADLNSVNQAIKDIQDGKRTLILKSFY